MRSDDSITRPRASDDDDSEEVGEWDKVETLVISKKEEGDEVKDFETEGEGGGPRALKVDREVCWSAGK